MIAGKSPARVRHGPPHRAEAYAMLTSIK